MGFFQSRAKIKLTIHHKGWYGRAGEVGTYGRTDGRTGGRTKERWWRDKKMPYWKNSPNGIDISCLMNTNQRTKPNARIASAKQYPQSKLLMSGPKNIRREKRTNRTGQIKGAWEEKMWQADLPSWNKCSWPKICAKKYSNAVHCTGLYVSSAKMEHITRVRIVVKKWK